MYGSAAKVPNIGVMEKVLETVCHATLKLTV